MFETIGYESATLDLKSIFAAKIVDTRATMPPPTQNTLRPAALSSPSLACWGRGRGMGFAARNVNRWYRPAGLRCAVCANQGFLSRRGFA